MTLIYMIGLRAVIFSVKHYHVCFVPNWMSLNSQLYREESDLKKDDKRWISLGGLVLQ